MTYTPFVVSSSSAALPAPIVPATLDGYQLRLPTFEGPLDLLLRLVERDQLPISDVSLVAVTDQFLAYLGDLAAARPETIAEFAAVGARLVLLKSRSLLPRPTVADEAEPDPGDLVRQLTEYQRIRDAARHLAERDRQGAGAFERGGGVAVPAPPALPPLASHPPTALVRAIRRRLSAMAPRAQLLVPRPLVTLREMIERVLAALGADRETSFRSLVRDRDDRHETLTAFLAVLVLIRRRILVAHQSELFGEIALEPAGRDPQPIEASSDSDDEFAADD
jgi:segregation and condensation protein A